MKNKIETSAPDKQEENPLSTVDKASDRISPDIETDTNFSTEEQTEVVRMAIQDAESDTQSLADWTEQRVKDLQMYDAAKPSIIEGLSKKGWQSDRNLGMVPATCDSYQATLLETCLNIDTLHFRSTESGDVDNSDNAEVFSKWGLGKQEADFFPEADDFIHNRVTQGFSVFKIYWKVWYRWVDKRIPIFGPKISNALGKLSRGKFKTYKIKTEKMRFEKGVIENISDVDDFLCPHYGKKIQDLDHCIEIIHLTGDQIEDYGDRKIFMNVTEDYIGTLQSACYNQLVGNKQINREKLLELGIGNASDLSSADLKNLQTDILSWYGDYKKNGRTERYRFYVDHANQKFLGGKPLRKVPGCRSGNYPFVGGAFIRRPGILRGKSLPKLIEDPTNAINEVYNQKTDYQQIENMPTGFYVPDETMRQKYELEPGNLYPIPDTKNLLFPNMSRSMAWADSDYKLLFDVIERLTGAASFFMSNTKGVSGTATRDSIINEKSETRFGLWVKRILEDFGEAITMWYSMYQDCAPSTLGERVLGKDGEKLFNQGLSIDSLRGSVTAYLSPDIIAGSKTLEKQIRIMTFQMAEKNMWFNPQINPKGNWELTADTFKAIGLKDVERYMPPKPKGIPGTSKEIDQEFSRFMKGESFDPPEGTTPAVIEHYQGHMKQFEEKYDKLEEEYRGNFDAHLFKTMMNLQKFMAQAQQEQMSNQLAGRMIQNVEEGTTGGFKPLQAAPERSMGQPNQESGMDSIQGSPGGA